MTSAEDRELVKATLAGDTEAFEVLVERYQKPFFNGAFRITQSHDDAVEATQASFVKIYDKLASFDPSYRFFSWAFRIVVNESLDLVRGRQRYAAELPTEELVDGHDNPEGDLSTSETGQRVQRALGRLRPAQRAVVVLRHFHELSYREMSDVLGISEKTVKSRLFSARQELRRMLLTPRS